MAKASVTGTIGDEKVELNDAATETTLRNLKSAIEDLAKQKNTNARKAAENLDRLSKQTKQTTEDFDDLSTEIDAMSDAIPSMGSAFAALGSVVTGTVGIIGGLTTKAFDLAQGFFTFGNRLSDATAGIPLIGSLTRTIDTTVDEFRQLSQVGASFSNSLAEVRLTAARASLPLDEFSRVVQSNANLLAQFGGTVSTGAKRFAEFSAGIREGELGTRLMGMGFSIEEINDRLAGYLEIQARQGRLERIQNQDLREGAAEYITQLDALAKLTGQERSALEDSIQAQQEDAKIRAMGARITDETARAQFQANLALMDSLGGLGTGLKDLADGIPQTELGKALRVTVPEIQNIATAMGRGAISADQARRQLAQLAPRMREFVRGLNPAQIQAIQDSMPGLAQALDLGASLNRLNNRSQAENIAAQQEGIQTLTEFFTSFEQTVTSIRKSIEETFLESPVFTLISDNLGRFADLFTADRVNGVVREFEDDMARFNTWFEGLISDIRYRGLWPALKTAVTDIFTGIKDFLFGRTETQVGIRNREIAVIEREIPGILENAFTGLSDWYNNSGLKDTFEEMANDITRMFSDALLGRELTSREENTVQQMKDEYNRLATQVFGKSDEEKARQDYLEKRLNEFENVQKGVIGRIPGMSGEGEKTFGFFENGTGKIENFGAGSPAMLHGREAVLTEEQLFRMANGVFNQGASQNASAQFSLVNQISRLNRNAFEEGLTRTTKIDIANLSNYTDSIKTLTNEMKTVSEKLSNIENFAPQELDTTEQVNSRDSDQLQALNTTMNKIYSEIVQSNDMSNKQLKATRGLSSNLI